MKRLILILVILFLLPIFASAQSTNSQITPEQAQAELKVERYLEAKSFKCNFENGYFAFWENGKLKSEITKDPLSLIFDSIDYKKSTARLIGNQGSSDIILTFTVGGVTFIEKTGSGSFISTTINFPRVNDKNLIDQYFAVHSRHIATILGAPMSSQYYGQCKIWDIDR